MLFGDVDQVNHDLGTEPTEIFASLTVSLLQFTSACYLDYVPIFLDDALCLIIHSLYYCTDTGF